MILWSSEHNHIYFTCFSPKKKLPHEPHNLAWALLTEDVEPEGNGPSQIRKRLRTKQ